MAQLYISKDTAKIIRKIPKKVKTDQYQHLQDRHGYIQIEIKISRKKATLTTH